MLVNEANHMHKQRHGFHIKHFAELSSPNSQLWLKHSDMWKRNSQQRINNMY